MPSTPTPEAIPPDAELTATQQVAPRNYAVLLDTAYEALKREGRENLVIGGNTYTSAGTDNIPPSSGSSTCSCRTEAGRGWTCGAQPVGNHRPDLTLPPSRNGTIRLPGPRAAGQGARSRRLPGDPQALPRRMGRRHRVEDKDLDQELDAKAADKWIRAAFEIAEWKRIYTLGWVHPTDTERNSTGLLTQSGERKTSYETYKRSG